MGTRPCRERSSRHREDEWSRSRGSAGFTIGTRGSRDRARMGFSPPQVSVSATAQACPWTGRVTRLRFSALPYSENGVPPK
jgi:hypothetical protein